MTAQHVDAPLAYLITFHTYGSWLHGAAKGSVDRSHSEFGRDFAPADQRRVATMRERMTDRPLRFSSEQRQQVAQTIEDVCRRQSWTLHAAHVRTNHVHVVVASAATPERVMNALKSWATRDLREAGLVATGRKVWSRHGSTRHLWDERSVAAACRYVLEGQGVDLD